jgi:hypothetical protein
MKKRFTSILLLGLLGSAFYFGHVQSAAKKKKEEARLEALRLEKKEKEESLKSIMDIRRVVKTPPGYKENSEKILKESDFLSIKKTHNNMMVEVSGIWIAGNEFYFKVNIQNLNNVPYNVAYSQFIIIINEEAEIHDKSNLVKTYWPKHVHNSTKIEIQPNENVTYIFATERFSIPDGKTLCFESWQKGNKEFPIRVSIDSNELSKAKNLL